MQDSEHSVAKEAKEVQDEAADHKQGTEATSALAGEAQTQAKSEPSSDKDDLKEAQDSKRPWLVLVNAPVDTPAHERLLELLENTKQPVQELILMGPSAKAACSCSELGARYGDFAQERGLKLLVCGMAARDYGAEGAGLNGSFTVTGFMEILLKVKQAKKAGVKVVVW